ncbi:MAG: sulfatase-like hydrolase/transferase [Verrucomicrobiales bacterium]|nr:sulfatase-like hydrolase/transferase [Verrucomicrobiales bacterium]
MIFRSSSALAAILFALSFPVIAAEKPNVLLIMADDLGFSDLGCYGGEIQTPNLDSIAENGLRFTQLYNTGRCWPTRGSLLTGFYAQEIRRDNLPGVPSGGGNRGIRPDWAKLAPTLLKPAGYRSYHTGKWHIDGMPIANGFDRSYSLKDQGRFFNPQRHWKDDKPLPPVEKGTDFYATTALADHAIEVLAEHETDYADAPFFHYLAFAAPHFPLHALPEDIAIYDEVYAEGWEKVRAKRWQKMRAMNLLDPKMVPRPSRPEYNVGPPYHFPDAFEILGPGEINKPIPWKTLTDEQKKFQAKKMAIHAAMIHRMDIEIGRVFEKIKSMGEWENTLVIFLSDNGASAEIMVRDDGHDPALPPGSAGTYLCLGPGWSTVCNTPFRRHKTWTHEGGIATPFVVSWPKGIEARGEIRRSPGHVIDVVPTLLELAGEEANLAKNAPESPGKSLVPLFERDVPNRHEALWWFHDGHKAIRMGNRKAVSANGGPWELYQLNNDRIESKDMAVAGAEELEDLKTRWSEMLAEFTKTATADLPPEALEKAKKGGNRNPKMNTAQAAAKPKRRWVLVGDSEELLINGRPAFLMKPEKPAAGNPWIFYGPTLNSPPDKAESWMHEKFLAAGVAVAGVDVGEAYGSPVAFPHFEALYAEMEKRGFSKKPALLGRSRGGLWVSSWAIANPDRVTGIGGIYPVYDLTTYPGLENAAPAHGLSLDELKAKLGERNPIERGAVLAKAKIPVYVIHGTIDKVVPLEPNSARLEKIYEAEGVGDLITVVKPEGQGHNFWRGFFEHQPLVDFLIARANAGAGNE